MLPTVFSYILLSTHRMSKRNITHLDLFPLQKSILPAHKALIIKTNFLMVINQKNAENFIVRWRNESLTKLEFQGIESLQHFLRCIDNTVKVRNEKHPLLK
jgi:hypothetical protein